MTLVTEYRDEAMPDLALDSLSTALVDVMELLDCHRERRVARLDDRWGLDGGHHDFSRAQLPGNRVTRRRGDTPPAGPICDLDVGSNHCEHGPGRTPRGLP